MRKQLLLATFLAYSFIASAGAETYADPKEISKFSVILFKRTCVMQLTNPDAMAADMDKKFSRMTEGKEIPFLKMTQADQSAIVWSAYIPNKAVAILVSDPKHKSCHVISPMGDKDASVSEFEKLYAEAKNNLKQAHLMWRERQVQASNNGPINSGFDITYPNITQSVMLSTGNGITKGAYEIYMTTFLHAIEKK